MSVKDRLQQLILYSLLLIPSLSVVGGCCCRRVRSGLNVFVSRNQKRVASSGQQGPAGSSRARGGKGRQGARQGQAQIGLARAPRPQPLRVSPYVKLALTRSGPRLEVIVAFARGRIMLVRDFHCIYPRKDFRLAHVFPGDRWSSFSTRTAMVVITQRSTTPTNPKNNSQP